MYIRAQSEEYIDKMQILSIIVLIDIHLVASRNTGVSQMCKKEEKESCFYPT